MIYLSFPIHEQAALRNKVASEARQLSDCLWSLKVAHVCPALELVSLSSAAVVGFIESKSALILSATTVVLCGEWKGNVTVEADNRIAARIQARVIDAARTSPERLAQQLLDDTTRIVNVKDVEQRRPVPPGAPLRNESGLCWCGCGGQPKGTSFFVPGHDRKAEAGLVKLVYGNVAGFLISHGFDPDKSTITNALNAMNS